MDVHAALAPSSEGTATLIGVGLAVVASILIAAGLNTQRLAHLKRSRRDGPSSSPLRGRPRPRSAHPHERTPLIVTTKPTLERSLSDPAPADRGRPQVQVVLPVVSESPPHSPPRTPTKRDRSTSRRRKPRLDKGFVRNPLWLLGFVLLNLGEFANFLAYGFAPPSVVAPLGLTTLVANVFLAPLIVREPFRRKDLLGVAVAILGGVTVVYASRSSDKKLTPDEFLAAISQPLFVSYAIVCCTCMSALAYLSRTKWGDRYVLVDLSLCALAGAFTVLSTKAISGFLNLYFLRMFRYWITWAVLVVLVSTALVQVNFVNKALQRFESRVVIPIQYITFALSTICGSALLYRDFEGVPAPSLLNFGFGTLISGAGVYLLTRDPRADSPPSRQDADSAPPTSPTSDRPRRAAPVLHLPASNPSSQASPTPLPLTGRAREGGAPTRTQGMQLLGVHLDGAPAAAAGPRARKLSLTLGGGYLLAGSPGTGLVLARQSDADGDGGESGSGSESGSEEERGRARDEEEWGG